MQQQKQRAQNILLILQKLAYFLKDNSLAEEYFRIIVHNCDEESICTAFLSKIQSFAIINDMKNILDCLNDYMMRSQSTKGFMKFLTASPEEAHNMFEKVKRQVQFHFYFSWQIIY